MYFSAGSLTAFFSGTHLREEQHVLDRRLARHEHRQTVDADTHARARGHAVLQRADEVHVDEHRFVVALFREAQLLLEAFELVDRVVQLGVGVAELLAVDEEFEALGQIGVFAVTLAEGRHFDGVVGHERRLDELLLAVLAEDGVDELAFAHRVVDLDVEPLAGFAQLFFALARDVVAGLLADEVGHRHTAERRLERHGLAVDGEFRGAVGGHSHPFEHLFGELHHPQVVLVGHINLHARELGVVRAVHALVAEVLAEFVDAVEAPDNQLFKVELVAMRR